MGKPFAGRARIRGGTSPYTSGRRVARPPLGAPIMLEPLQKLSRSLAATLGLALAVPSAAFAQTAPVIGDHYAARASDTGFAGTNGSGGYGASVPLILPRANGGLPVPLQVALGGHRFGAAGLGGDVPLSFILHHPGCVPNAPCNVAHRRPVSGGDAPLQARDRYSVVLDGRSIDLVPIAQGKWRARQRADRSARSRQRRVRAV